MVSFLNEAAASRHRDAVVRLLSCLGTSELGSSSSAATTLRISGGTPEGRRCAPAVCLVDQFSRAAVRTVGADAPGSLVTPPGRRWRTTLSLALRRFKRQSHTDSHWSIRRTNHSGAASGNWRSTDVPEASQNQAADLTRGRSSFH